MLSTVCLVTIFSEGEGEIPLSTTLFFGSILLALIVCLALEEKIHAKKSVISGLCAAVCLLAGAVLQPLSPLYNP